MDPHTRSPRSTANRQSVRYTRAAFSWDGEALKLVKMADALDIRWSRPLGGDPTTVTVSKDPAGRYFVSILVKETIKVKPITPNMVGLDLGLSHIAILSTGHKIGNPRFLQKDEKRLKKAQQNLSKK